MSQWKCKVVHEKRITINKEVHKLIGDGFIIEVKYPSWLSNVVLVRKASNKLHTCVNFIDLKFACPKGPYTLPNINRMINGSSDYKMLSFLNTYLGYNYIKISHIRSPKMTFTSNHGNYYYNAMPFRLKNIDATYHRLMDAMLS